MCTFATNVCLFVLHVSINDSLFDMDVKTRGMEQLIMVRDKAEMIMWHPIPVSIDGIFSGTWELGTPKGLPKTVLNSEVVLFLRSIAMY